MASGYHDGDWKFPASPTAFNNTANIYYIPNQCETRSQALDMGVGLRQGSYPQESSMVTLAVGSGAYHSMLGPNTMHAYAILEAVFIK